MSDTDEKRICGAECILGRPPCTRRPAPGETRCSYHGGAVGRVRQKRDVSRPTKLPDTPEEPAVPPVAKAPSMLNASVRRELKRAALLEAVVEQQARGLVIRKLTAEDVQRLEQAKARRRSSPVIAGVVA